MASRRVSDTTTDKTPRRPATTPDGRENQIIADAMDLAQKQIRDGTASSQLITHFVKLGSSRERLEQARLKEEIALAQAKQEQMASQAHTEELLERALIAFRSYSGEDPDVMVTDEFDVD